MASRAFDEFVQREQESAKRSEGVADDWEVERKEWLRRLEELFAQVSEYLREYVDAGQITVSYRNIELNEEYVGPYTARAMAIAIGSKTIVLEPIGTFLVGSKGRVDVVGPVARGRLMLLDSEMKSLSQLLHVSVGINAELPTLRPAKSPSDIRWVWRIVPRPPGREVVEINKDTFLSLLLEIANG